MESKEEQTDGIQKACKDDNTAEEKQRQQNKPPNKHLKDLSAEEKKKKYT